MRFFFHLLARDSEPELEPEPQSRPFLPEPEPPKYSLLRISSFRLILSFIPVFILLSPVEILLSIYLNICLSLYLYFLQFIMTEKQKLSSKKTAIYVWKFLFTFQFFKFSRFFLILQYKSTAFFITIHFIKPFEENGQISNNFSWLFSFEWLLTSTLFSQEFN